MNNKLTCSVEHRLNNGQCLIDELARDEKGGTKLSKEAEDLKEFIIKDLARSIAYNMLTNEGAYDLNALVSTFPWGEDRTLRYTLSSNIFSDRAIEERCQEVYQEGLKDGKCISDNCLKDVINAQAKTIAALQELLGLTTGM